VNASNAVQNALDNAMTYTAAHFAVDDALYRDVAGFNDDVQRRVSQLIAQQDLGVAVDHCEVLGNIPPRQLKPAFDRVITARENRTKSLNDAHTFANQIRYQASAQAAAITNEAAADKARLVKSISADAKRFKDLLPNYERNPDLFVQAQLLGAMSSVLTNVQEKVYLSERVDGKSRELRLLLNRELPKRKTETQ
jgi:membrane protease subunit HflK